MTKHGLSEEFADVFRTRLVDHVAQAPASRPHRTVVWGAGIALAVALGGTAAAAASGLLTLPDANGTTAAQEFTSPEDALRWQEENAGVVRLIPVYEQDGTTRVGQFQVGQ